MKLTKKHRELYFAICKRGLSNGCHDLLPEEQAMLTTEEWQELDKEFHIRNGDPENHNTDGCIMSDFTVKWVIEELSNEMIKDML